MSQDIFMKLHVYIYRSELIMYHMSFTLELNLHILHALKHELVTQRHRRNRNNINEITQYVGLHFL